VEPSWSEWVTACSLAVIAGVGVAAVRADAGGPAPAQTSTPVTGGYDYAPAPPAVGQGPATPAAGVRTQDLRAQAVRQAARRPAQHGSRSTAKRQDSHPAGKPKKRDQHDRHGRG
jgi:hypothetical protein